MSKFRKKPVEIEAVQLTYENLLKRNEEKLPKWFLDKVESGEIKITIAEKIDKSQYGIISTLEGDMKANADDWIIKGVSGEVYPCKPDIFELTYERA